MNRAIRSVILWMCATTISFGVAAQDRAARFRHLTIEDGLPQNMVDCMIQDHQGFMWFGTWNGLCRYDGYSFETFNSDIAKSNSLKNDFIYSLKEDSHHNIWVGTREGLQVFLYGRSTFHVPELARHSGILKSDIRDLEIWNDSTLLLATSQGLGVYRILNREGELEPMTIHKDQFEINEPINAVLADREDNIWLGTDRGVLRISSRGEMERFRFEESDPYSLTADHVLSLYEDAQGAVWIGTEVGLNRVMANDRFERFYHFADQSNSLVHNAVMDITESASGDLLLATLGGFSVFSSNRESFTNYVYEFGVDRSLSNDFLNCVWEDRQGNIWIGTERGGINFFNASQNRIEHFEHEEGNPQSLSLSTINSVFEDDRFLWIGTAGGGLNRYEKSSGKYKHYINRTGDEGSLSFDFVTSICRDRDGFLWVGTWGNGLNKLVGEGTSEEHFKHFRFSEYPGLCSDFVSAFRDDGKGNLWVATLGGLTKFDGDVFTAQLSDDGRFKITEAGCLLFDRPNSLWVGTRKGLFHLDLNQESTKVSKYLNDPKVATSLSGSYVISILKDRKGNLWFGTYGKGLNRMYAEGDAVYFESYSTTEGLSNTVVYGIEEDSRGFLWLSTDYGLSRFDPRAKSFQNFYVSDGLQNNQYYWSASYTNSDGKLYFGGMNGLDSFYPDWVEEESNTTQMVITTINLLNDPVVPGKSYNGIEVLTQSLFDTRKIELSYKEKIVGFEFSSLDYTEPGMIRYAYILEGFEENWNYVPSNRRYASYTNLKPGKYTFRVKASSVHGDFDGPERALEIIIRPPFWVTTWFQLLLVVAIALLFLGYVRWRTYSLKQQKTHLEKQVAERTERINQQKEELREQAEQLRRSNHDLEEKQSYIAEQNQQLEHQNKEIAGQRDELITLNRKLNLVSQLKLSFFTNISHEFRTPLTLIIGPLERLLKERTLDSEVTQSLALMNRNAQRLLHLITQIMDFRKIEKGQMDLKVGPTQFPQFCKSIYEAFLPLAEVKHIEFSYQQKDVPDEVWQDTEKIENVLYNLLSNAFKYTPEKGKIQLIVQGLTNDQSRLIGADSLGQSKTVLSIKVVDSGKGISSENLPLVFKRFYRIESEEAFKIGGSGIGLALAEELIKSHHGGIFVESTLGEGSAFEIQFPCLEGSYATYEVTPQANHEISIRQQVELLRGEFLSSRDYEIEVEQNDENRSITSKEKVLIVEDNHDLRKFLSFHLGKVFHVVAAKDGEEGLVLAKNKNPDLIISDVMMPKMNGMELCARLKNDLQTSHIPLVLLTAKSTVESQIEGLQIGADDYLAKPFNLDLLLAKIANLINSRRKLRQLFMEGDGVKASEVTPNLRDQKFLEEALSIVNTNIDNSSFGARELVNELGVSRSLLHKKLTALTGQSTADFINQIRMKQACQLLKNTELNISEVAYAVGYNDPKYFSRLFSKYFGRSPKEYLKDAILR